MSQKLNKRKIPFDVEPLKEMLEMCLYFIENTNIDHYCKLDDEYAPWKIGNFKQKYSLKPYNFKI